MAFSDELRGDRIVLRRFRKDDVPELIVGCNDPTTQRFLPQLPAPYTEADAHEWINVRSPAAFADGGAAYAIAEANSDRVIGGVGLGQVHLGAAVVGYWVAPRVRGQGIAAAATTMLAGAAFDQGIGRLALRTEWENTPSQRTAIAAGFRWEGVERGGGRGRDGSRHDMIVWARLAADDPGPIVRLLPDLPGHNGSAAGELTDGIVTLRPLCADDVDDTHALRSLPDVVETSVPPAAPARAEVVHFTARSQATWLAGQRADLTIRDAATGAYAGDIGLYYFEPPTQQAMVGYSLAPAWRGRGYSTRAVRLVAEWAFANTEIRRLVAGTAPDNIASQRVLERAGFTREGYQRSRLPGRDGARIDDILYALLPSEQQNSAPAAATTAGVPASAEAAGTT